MAVEERDAHTGYKTTGHEWNGIKELNAPVPKPVFVAPLQVTVLPDCAQAAMAPSDDATASDKTASTDDINGRASRGARRSRAIAV